MTFCAECSCCFALNSLHQKAVKAPVRSSVNENGATPVSRAQDPTGFHWAEALCCVFYAEFVLQLVPDFPQEFACISHRQLLLLNQCGCSAVTGSFLGGGRKRDTSDATSVTTRKLTGERQNTRMAVE